MRVKGSLKQDVFQQSAGQLISMFLRFSEMKGLSPRTVFFYKDKLGRFLAHLQDKPMNSQGVLSFLDYLRAHGNSQESLGCYYRAMGVFFRWAQTQGLLSENPMNSVHMKWRKPPLVETLSPTLLQTLMDTARKGKRNAARNTAILMLLLDTGIRPGELCSLTLKDVSLENCFLRVRGKVGERMLPLSPTTKKALIGYLRSRKPLGDAFFTIEGGEPMTVENLRRLFNRLKKQSGLGCRVYPYLFRHTAATSYLQNGADLETVRRLLGHTTYAMTQRYISLNMGDLARAQNEFSLVKQLKHR